MIWAESTEVETQTNYSTPMTVSSLTLPLNPDPEPFQENRSRLIKIPTLWPPGC